MDDIEPIYGLILAGGESRRMGQAKGLLEYRGKTLLTHCIEQLSVCCEAVYVVAGAHYRHISEHTNPPKHIIHAPNWRGGMRRSLRTGVLALPAGHILLSHVDGPGITRNTLEQLVEPPIRRVRIPRFRGRPGHPVLIPSWLRKRLTQSDRLPLRDILRRSQPEYVQTRDPAVIRNLNSRSDWRQFLARAE